jgi:two-component system, OmpR family, phosphate regulon sensor histidine kinase PhoR
MKNRLRKYIVWITLLLLAILLFFQVKWIMYSVNFQEKVFKNSVDLALNKTIALLNRDQQVCSAMRECMGCDNSKPVARLLSPNIWDQIHASIDAELAVYHINLDYDLFITSNEKDTLRSGAVDLVVKRGTCYTTSLRELLQTSGYELVVSFPNRSRFFLNEAGVMLFSSILLILLIVFFFIQMVRLYLNEVRLSENVRELINNISHEFKTPISSIALASNLIRKGKPEEAKIREYGDLIYSENQKLQRQVDSLLDLAAIEWEEFEYYKKPEKINDVVRDAISSVRLLIEEKNGEVRTDYSEDLPQIPVDKIHMTNAIANLLTNALKYSSGPPLIRIRTFIQQDHIVLEISDNGIGIPQKYQKYIFDKYFRVPTGDMHNIKGFGIGLSYVKSVVSGHLGKIHVSSEPGKGSTFTIILPKTDQK